MKYLSLLLLLGLFCCHASSEVLDTSLAGHVNDLYHADFT